MSLIPREQPTVGTQPADRHLAFHSRCKYLDCTTEPTSARPPSFQVAQRERNTPEDAFGLLIVWAAAALSDRAHGEVLQGDSRVLIGLDEVHQIGEGQVEGIALHVAVSLGLTKKVWCFGWHRLRDYPGSARDFKLRQLAAPRKGRLACRIRVFACIVPLVDCPYQAGCPAKRAIGL